MDPKDLCELPPVTGGLSHRSHTLNNTCKKHHRDGLLLAPRTRRPQADLVTSHGAASSPSRSNAIRERAIPWWKVIRFRRHSNCLYAVKRKDQPYIHQKQGFCSVWA